MSEWISVKDRLTKKIGSYLCFGEKLSTEVEVLDYTLDCWWWIEGGDPSIATGVTHWQPKPEPPEVKQEKVIT